MAHPVPKITRFGMEGYGVRRAGSFAGKASGTPIVITAAKFWDTKGGFGRHSTRSNRGYSK